jgi:hypothetical protein
MATAGAATGLRTAAEAAIAAAAEKWLIAAALPAAVAVAADVQWRRAAAAADMQ